MTSLFFASRISYEKDLFKVFLARNMNSMEISEKISRKFHSNFSKPTHLCFDVEDLQFGLSAQRQLDRILEDLIKRHGDIASFDSISYLMSPDSIVKENIAMLSEVYTSWPGLEKAFKTELKDSDLSESACETMEKSFDSIGRHPQVHRNSPFGEASKSASPNWSDPGIWQVSGGNTDS